MRAGELVGLRWSNLQIDKAPHIQVTRGLVNGALGELKTASSRRIYLLSFRLRRARASDPMAVEANRAAPMREQAASATGMGCSQEMRSKHDGGLPTNHASRSSQSIHPNNRIELSESIAPRL